MSIWQQLWDGLKPPAEEYSRWLKQNTAVAAEFHHQQYPGIPERAGLHDHEYEEYLRYRNFYCIV